MATGNLQAEFRTSTTLPPANGLEGFCRYIWDHPELIDQMPEYRAYLAGWNDGTGKGFMDGLREGERAGIAAMQPIPPQTIFTRPEMPPANHNGEGFTPPPEPRTPAEEAWEHVTQSNAVWELHTLKDAFLAGYVSAQVRMSPPPPTEAELYVDGQRAGVVISVNIDGGQYGPPADL